MSIADSALAQIHQLHPYQPGKPVEELERELGIREAFKLASNENPLGCSPRAREAIARASEHVELYPDANAYYLKRRLAQKLGIGENQITIGNGSNDVLDIVARTFLDRDGEAVFSRHAFMVYGMVSLACGATSRVAPALPADHAQAYGHDLDAMAALINARTRVVFVANPNNPTGTWLERKALESFVASIPERVAVVIDEAYFEYVEETGYPNALEWLARYPNLIVTRTFSKIYGLAALRVGYAVSSPELCNLFNRVRQPFNGNAIGLAAALAALDDDEFVTASRETNSAGLRRMREEFSARGIEFLPSVGNFLTVRFGPDTMRIYQALLERGVIVRPIANYELPEFLRISVGTQAQLDRLFTVLGEIL